MAIIEKEPSIVGIPTFTRSDILKIRSNFETSGDFNRTAKVTLNDHGLVHNAFLKLPRTILASGSRQDQSTRVMQAITDYRIMKTIHDAVPGLVPVTFGIFRDKNAVGVLVEEIFGNLIYNKKTNIYETRATAEEFASFEQKINLILQAGILLDSDSLARYNIMLGVTESDSQRRLMMIDLHKVKPGSKNEIRFCQTLMRESLDDFKQKVGLTNKL